jgi:hypothetical protein
VTGTATDVTDTGATLTGKVNPNGNATKYAFQLAETQDFANSQVFPSEAADAGSGTADVDVAISAAGLKPQTTYFFRLAATSSAGGNFGETKQFTTTNNGSSTPSVVTGAASALTQTTATVSGSINPAGKEVTYAFAYGRTNGYGQRTANRTIPAGTSPVAVSATLSGLTAGTLYHYRLVAVNSAGTAALGVDRTFTTSGGGGGGGGGGGDDAGRKRPRGLGFRVSPGRDATAPFRFTARGRLRLPKGVARSACSGRVRIIVTQGGEELRRKGTFVRANCRFRRTVTVRPNGSAGRLQVRAQFRATQTLLAKRSQTKTVRFGPR